MAYEPYTRTNQKLHFCGLALENWLRAERDSSLLLLRRSRPSVRPRYSTCTARCLRCATRLPTAIACRMPVGLPWSIFSTNIT